MRDNERWIIELGFDKKKRINYYYSSRIESQAELTQLKLSSFNYRIRLAQTKLIWIRLARGAFFFYTALFMRVTHELEKKRAANYHNWADGSKLKISLSKEQVINNRILKLLGR
jgi:hypothetical protein